MVSAVEHSHRSTNLSEAVVLPDGCEIAKDVSVVPLPPGSVAACAPESVGARPFERDAVNDNFDSKVKLKHVAMLKFDPLLVFSTGHWSFWG